MGEKTGEGVGKINFDTSLLNDYDCRLLLPLLTFNVILWDKPDKPGVVIR